MRIDHNVVSIALAEREQLRIGKVGLLPLVAHRPGDPALVRCLKLGKTSVFRLTPAASPFTIASVAQPGVDLSLIHI